VGRLYTSIIFCIILGWASNKFLINSCGNSAHALLNNWSEELTRNIKIIVHDKIFDFEPWEHDVMEFMRISRLKPHATCDAFFEWPTTTPPPCRWAENFLLIWVAQNVGTSPFWNTSKDEHNRPSMKKVRAIFQLKFFLEEHGTDYSKGSSHEKKIRKKTKF